MSMHFYMYLNSNSIQILAIQVSALNFCVHVQVEHFTLQKQLTQHGSITAAPGPLSCTPWPCG